MPIPKYAVIACPECRTHAQIIEYGKATTKCQNCGFAIKIKKLRIFHTSDILDEAISARTQLQAKMHGQGFGSGSMPEGDFVDDRRISVTEPKRSAQKIILDLMRSADSALEIEVLKMHALHNDVDAKNFDKILNSLLLTGNAYSPKTGYVRLV